MTTYIPVDAGESRFAEDKDAARRLRLEVLLPAIARDEQVILDFQNIDGATQSFVHALIGEVLKRYGEDSLTKLEFKNCSPAVRSVIALVVDYSLGGFPTPLS